MKHDLKGLENLIGVPGTLGGALMMNAGACVSQVWVSEKAFKSIHIYLKHIQILYLPSLAKS